jgi:hypothetical protein
MEAVNNANRMRMEMIPAYQSTPEEERNNWQGRDRFNPRSALPPQAPNWRAALGWVALVAFVSGFVVTLTLLVI